MKSGKAYQKHNFTTTNYDAIVIGSGIGGLSVSAILAKANQRVLVLEQHYEIGGYTHTFKRRDYEWDVGLHYIGDVHIEGTVLNKAFQYLSNEQLKWTPMPKVYDKAVFGEQVYEFVSGRDNQKAQLKKYFPSPEDVVSIDAYFQLLEEVRNLNSNFYIEKALPVFLANLTGNFLRKGLLKYAEQSTLSVLQKITNNPTLIGVLTAQYGDYGLPPAQSSFYMHAMLANHYMEGAAFPVGGSGSIARTIIPVIEGGGGAVLYNAKVIGILVNNNKAVGVKMEDGQTIFAKKIISDAGIVNTYTHLLPAAIIEKHQFKTLLKKVKPAAAHVGLYIGIKQSAEDLNLPKNNFWLFPADYDHDKLQAQYTHLEAPLPVAYISFPSAKDPDFEKKYPNKATIEVIGLVPYDWFVEWEGTSWKKRGESYDQLKEKIAQQLLAQLYRVQPQLKGKIDYYELSTPLSTRKFTNHDKGEIYGLAHTPERFQQTFLRATTPVKNLYLTGQDVVIASIGGGLMGGILAASAILKRNMFNAILKS